MLAEAYVSLLLDAERKEEWLCTVELMTEINCMQVELPPDALEAAIKTLAKGAGSTLQCARHRNNCMESFAEHLTKAESQSPSRGSTKDLFILEPTLLYKCASK